MPPALAATPRKMLPPPMTIAICTPERRDLAHLGGDPIDHGGVDPVALVPGERLSRGFRRIRR